MKTQLAKCAAFVMFARSSRTMKSPIQDSHTYFTLRIFRETKFSPLTSPQAADVFGTRVDGRLDSYRTYENDSFFEWQASLV